MTADGYLTIVKVGIKDTTPKFDVLATTKSGFANATRTVPHIIYQVLAVARICIAVFCFYIVSAGAAFLMELFTVCIKNVCNGVGVLRGGSFRCGNFLA
jgi:hypothetical protein